MRQNAPPQPLTPSINISAAAVKKAGEDAQVHVSTGQRLSWCAGCGCGGRSGGGLTVLLAFSFPLALKKPGGELLQDCKTRGGNREGEMTVQLDSETEGYGAINHDRESRNALYHDSSLFLNMSKYVHMLALNPERAG